MEFAQEQDFLKVMELYKRVVEAVNRTEIRLGWNTSIYPDEGFVKEAIARKELCILREKEKVIAAAVVNHNANPEYDTIPWNIKAPKEKICVIHALAVDPDCRGGSVSGQFLADIEGACRKQGVLAIHLDVIDTNTPAYKMYLRNGYQEIQRISMFYEVVGTREFWMLERVL